MMETCPDNGLSEAKELKVGRGVAGALLCGEIGSRIVGSNTSNGTGNIFGLDLKSSCPKSQKSML